MNLANWLHQSGLTRPDAPALYFGHKLHARYSQFAHRSCAIGRHLMEQYGIKPGDRVALFARNCPEYLEVLYGVLWVGAVIVPVNNKLHPREAAWIVENAQADVVITETGDLYSNTDDLKHPAQELGLHSEELSEVARHGSAGSYFPPAETRGDQTAWLFYTSGTTGRPKGVMTTHDNLRMMATSYALDVDTVTPQDVALYAAPMSHGAGLYNFQFVRAGAAHVIPPSCGFDPAEIEDLGRSLGNLVFFAAPTMIKRLLVHAEATGWRGEGIKSVTYGGGPMYLADINHALDVFGPKFIQIYGQGESPMTITAMPRDIVADTTHPRADARRASVGFAQSCVEVRIVDTNMNEVAPGQVGEIVVRGDTVMAGYWRNPEATTETIVDGWLRTGDLGAMDTDGFVTLTDRSKDVIISGGTNIYPREVEEVLLNHEDIFETAVIGAPHPEWGEEVIAFVVVGKDCQLDKDSLDAWCKSQIASFKKPRRYIFMSELPKNSYGKVLKTSLRERLSLMEDHSESV